METTRLNHGVAHCLVVDRSYVAIVSSEFGIFSLAKLVKQIDVPRDLVVMAIGWLAREEKIWIDESHRRRMISLRESCDAS